MLQQNLEHQPLGGGRNSFAPFPSQKLSGDFDARQNYDWISTAGLLLVFQPHRDHCDISQNGSMVGRRLP
jgi:hypothetical protein